MSSCMVGIEPVFIMDVLCVTFLFKIGFLLVSNIILIYESMYFMPETFVLILHLVTSISQFFDTTSHHQQQQ